MKEITASQIKLLNIQNYIIIVKLLDKKLKIVNKFYKVFGTKFLDTWL